jgi:hypothetical protein
MRKGLIISFFFGTFFGYLCSTVPYNEQQASLASANPACQALEHD